MADIVRNIVLNGRMGDGFTGIGNTLTSLGMEIDKLSQKIINFGKSSIDTYKDYEYNMTQARIAQSTRYGKGTKELDEAMESLDKYAQYWAKTTIFHTKDVSNAIMDASRAGLNAEEIIASMPAIMQLAQAGGLDLTQTLEMVMKSMKALGYDVNTELTDFTNAWVFAANYSMGSVEEFGAAMMKLGATMRFTDSKEELFALIGLMHDMGTSGSESATLLRTSIMRILAPSGVASRTMQLLGATDDEIKGIMEDTQKLAALQWLEEQGFNPFDEATGQAKPILDIYAQLGAILASVSGGYENISKNQTALGVLGVIFGNRGITGAINIISALEKAANLRDKLLEGGAEGYGEYGQMLMLETLYGTTELLNSRIEELERKTGEALKTPIQKAQEALGQIVDDLNNMDSGSFSTVVAGLETVAALGPGLILAGTGFRMIGQLLTPTGAYALALGGITAAAVALAHLEEVHNAEAFGLGELDTQEIMNYVRTLGEDFTTAYNEVDKFKQSVVDAKNAYQEASATFATNLLTAVLTGNTITPEQQEQFMTLGTQMYAAVQQGLSDAQNASIAYWTLLFGGDVTEEEFQNIQRIISAGYEDTLAQAAQVNSNIKSILMKGFQQGFTEEDYAQILAFMNEYNAMVARASAEAQERQDYINQKNLLHKAQTASLSEVMSTASAIQSERDSVLQKAEQNFWAEYYGLEYDWDYAIKNGLSIDGAAATEEGKAAALQGVKDRYEAYKLAQAEKYDSLLYTLWNTQVLQSDYGDAYTYLQELAGFVLDRNIDMGKAIQLFTGKYGHSKYGSGWPNEAHTNLSNTLARMIAGYGGYEGLEQRITDYQSKGLYEQANALRLLYTMQQISDEYTRTKAVSYDNSIMSFLMGDSRVVELMNGGTLIGNGSANFLEFMGLSQIGQAQEKVREYRALQNEIDGLRKKTWPTTAPNSVYEERDQEIAGIEARKDQLAAEIQQLYSDFQTRNGIEPAELDIKTILDSSAVDEYVPPDKTATIFYDIVVRGTGNEGSGGTGYFAAGGRADTPSIFGEAGAEWAIPESHTQRTAELLNAARAASGFSWPELLSRTGGLNANAEHTPTTLVYSPTINAADVTGVREALIADKERMEKWFRNRILRDEIEVYA